MRTTILAAVMMLGFSAMTSSAEAQLVYSYGNGAYPVYSNSGVINGSPQQGYYGGYATPGVYSGAPGFYTGTPMQNQVTPGYVGPPVQPFYGFPQTTSTYAVPAGSSLYGGGYTRSAQYGYRRYGSGRTFGSNVPRVYTIYQPRSGGLFDR